LQQPVQLDESQDHESLQIPLVQLSKVPHALHAMPEVPQNAASLPDLQVLPSQQPLRQDCHEQPAVQLPLRHWSDPLHCWQVAPFTPHEVVRCPGLQKSPSQQPVQELAVQEQVWFTHSWLEPQTAQAWPPVPQAGAVLPGVQFP
jgi:hypothetical protein